MTNEIKTEKPKRVVIPRQKMPEQAPQERIRNFKEVPFGYTSELAQQESLRCIQCKKPLCVDGCPVHIDIPGFIKQIAEGNFLEAANILKKDNILPAVCGRVCPQEDQCEKLCILAKKGESVAIGRLERFAADYEAEVTAKSTEKKTARKNTGKKVAVVGSGPASLACAGDLAKFGYQVTVFEALHKAGGVLVYGIPEFRLPKVIVEREVNCLKELGVEFEMNTVIGRTRTIEELMQEDGYEAVFIASGAGLPVFMGIPGENLIGVYSANEYLTRANLMKAYKFPQYDTPIKMGGTVAVVGGGNVAMDAVRTALRLGAENAYIIYRRSNKEMPARLEEIHHAEEEGVQFHLLTNPLRVLGDDRGWVRSIECIKMELGEPDASGRRKPTAVKGSEFELKVDTVIIAIGSGSNPLIASTTPGLSTDSHNRILVKDVKTGETSKKGVYAGGDIVTGAATVILAMGAGRNAAAAINQYLKG